MKHLKRMSFGILSALVLFWPLLAWWSNVEMATAVLGMWLKFLVVCAAIYAVGMGIEAWKDWRENYGDR